MKTIYFAKVEKKDVSHYKSRIFFKIICRVVAGEGLVVPFTLGEILATLRLGIKNK